MRDAAQRLMDDLRWRLSPSGRRFRPDRPTLRSWGAAEIPSAVPVILWFVVFILSTLLITSNSMPGEAAAMFMPLSWVLGGFAISRWARSSNRRNIEKAYRRLIEGNERFMLIEYTRYIRRKIRLAEGDPVLGGPEEVRRLRGIHRKLRKVLENGQPGRAGAPVRSILSDEADFAESLIEVYESPDDPLADLDARLPADIRARLDEFEDDNRRVERRRRAEHEA